MTEDILGKGGAPGAAAKNAFGRGAATGRCGFAEANKRSTFFLKKKRKTHGIRNCDLRRLRK